MIKHTPGIRVNASMIILTKRGQFISTGLSQTQKYLTYPSFSASKLSINEESQLCFSNAKRTG
jgi:hypothetical protein